MHAANFKASISFPHPITISPGAKVNVKTAGATKQEIILLAHKRLKGGECVEPVKILCVRIYVWLPLEFIPCVVYCCCRGPSAITKLVMSHEL